MVGRQVYNTLEETLWLSGGKMMNVFHLPCLRFVFAPKAQSDWLTFVFNILNMVFIEANMVHLCVHGYNDRTTICLALTNIPVLSYTHSHSILLPTPGFAVIMGMCSVSFLTKWSNLVWSVQNTDFCVCAILYLRWDVFQKILRMSYLTIHFAACWSTTLNPNKMHKCLGF